MLKGSFDKCVRIDLPVPLPVPVPPPTHPIPSHLNPTPNSSPGTPIRTHTPLLGTRIVRELSGCFQGGFRVFSPIPFAPLSAVKQRGRERKGPQKSSRNFVSERKWPISSADFPMTPMEGTEHHLRLSLQSPLSHSSTALSHLSLFLLYISLYDHSLSRFSNLSPSLSLSEVSLSSI